VTSNRRKALEDLIVRTEIFCKYRVHAKAQSGLQKLASLFPGEKRDPRGCGIYTNGELCRRKSKTEACPPKGPATVEAEPVGAVSAAIPACIRGHDAVTFEDFQINQKIFRSADAACDVEHGG